MDIVTFLYIVYYSILIALICEQIYLFINEEKKFKENDLLDNDIF